MRTASPLAVLLSQTPWEEHRLRYASVCVLRHVPRATLYQARSHTLRVQQGASESEKGTVTLTTEGEGELAGDRGGEDEDSASERTSHPGSRTRGPSVVETQAVWQGDPAAGQAAEAEVT